MNPEPEASPVSRSVIVALRVLLLVLSTGALAAALVLRAREGGAGAEAGTGARYSCPMHPEVTASAPGQCPICRMALERTTPSSTPGSTTRAETALMADFTAVDNVRKHRITDFVRHRALLPNVQELRGPAWVEADLTISAVFYTDQVEALAADEPGSFSLTDAPKVTVAVRRTEDAVARWDASTSRIRFRPDRSRAEAAAARLEPGQVGWLEVARRPREVLGVPAAAVLQSPEGPFVLVPVGGMGFEKRAIQIGETLPKQGFAVVLSGLEAQERVVSRAAFFLDAERRTAGRAMPEGSGGAP